MHVNEIQKRLSAIVKAMASKGLVKPDAKISLEADSAPYAYLTWTDPLDERQIIGPSHFIRADTVLQILNDTDAWIAALPSADEAKFKVFMGAVAKAVDLGREHGIDVEFINPLAETLKRLSENALTFQGEAA